MLPSPPSALAAGAASVVVAAFLLGIGYLFADTLLGRRPVDRVFRWALAVPALGLFVVALMLGHMATGGRILSAPWITRGVTVAAAVLAAVRMARRGRSTPLDRRGRWLAVAVVIGGLLVWGTPVFRVLPLDFLGDTHWHAGWASQLLNGEPVPAGVITGDIPNYYPWLFHATSAFVAAFTPGGRVLHALGPLHLLLVTGTLLGLFVLGRELTGRRSTGAWTALLAGLSGGVGFFLLRYRDVVISPRYDEGRAALRYGGDLLYRRSYNVAFNNLSPPLPRDIALVMLVAFLALLVAGLHHRSLPLLTGGGLVLGMAGLSGAESAIVAGGAAVALSILPVGIPRRRVALALLAPAALIAGIWLVPMAVNYARLGGFVNITGVEPVDLPAWAVLVAWGVSTPLAFLGAWWWGRRLDRGPAPRLVLAVAAISVFLLLGAALIPGALGQALLTLGRRHRYWPMLHLAVAMLAAVGIDELLRRFRDARGRWLAGGLVVALAIPSPIVASISAPSILGEPAQVAASLRGRSDTLLNVLSAPPGRRCVVAVLDRREQAMVWAYTGYRLVVADWKTNLRSNRARIRWRDVAQDTPSEGRRRADNAALTRGELDPPRWQALAESYGVDAVVVPAPRVEAPPFQGRTRLATNGPSVVVRLGPCDG